MAIAVFYDVSTDTKIAYEIHKCLSAEPYDTQSVFRRQLLDLVRDNVSDAFDHGKLSEQ